MKKAVILRSVITALFFLSLIIFLLPSGTAAQKKNMPFQKTEDTANLTWYTSLPLVHAKRLSNAFKIKTGIDIDIVRDSTFLIRDKLLSEFKNGRTQADILTIADISTFAELKNRNLLLHYPSPHYQSYPLQYKDDGYWAVFALFGICIAYDETRVSHPPSRWTDLLEERWKGRIGLEDIREAGSQYGQYYLLREKLGIAFWEKLLRQQQPKIYKSTPDLADAVLKGEIDIAAEFSIHDVYSYRVKKGTSLQGVYPEEGIPGVANPVAILASTEKPARSRMFFDFLLSQEGQTLMQNLNYKYSVRSGIGTLPDMPSMADLKILFPLDIIDYGTKQDSYVREFYQLLSGNDS